MSWGLCAAFHNFLFLCIWAQSEKNLLLPPSWGLRKPVARAAPRRQAEIRHAVCLLPAAGLVFWNLPVPQVAEALASYTAGVSGRN